MVLTKTIRIDMEKDYLLTKQQYNALTREVLNLMIGLRDNGVCVSLSMYDNERMTLYVHKEGECYSIEFTRKKIVEPSYSDNHLYALDIIKSRQIPLGKYISKGFHLE